MRDHQRQRLLWNPCKNGGVCTDKPDGFSCACSGDYIGTTCTVYQPPGDLNLSITNTQGRSCADGGDMVAYSVTGLTSTTATLSSTPSSGCLAAGDEVLLINLQGTSTGTASIFNTGNWELHIVQSIAGGTVTFTVAKQRFYGDGVADDTNLGTGVTNQRVMLQRVPKYAGLSVAPGRTLTAAAWNGVKGGVFALRLDTTGDVEGAITMAGNGYRGGVTTPAGQPGQAGESLRGVGAVPLFANVGGGAGGTGSPGCAGGGGGYSSKGGGASVTCGGVGGVGYGDAALDKLFLGSGGGAGGSAASLASSPAGAVGGNGGGIVLILAADKVTGSLTVAGTDGYGDAAECTVLPSSSTTDCWDDSGPGGGGAGGSILVQSAGFSGVTNIVGGAGGNGVDLTAGNGGAGSAGRSKTN
jgi:hypothetical protein